MTRTHTRTHVHAETVTIERRKLQFALAGPCDTIRFVLFFYSSTAVTLAGFILMIYDVSYVTYA